MEAKPVLHYFTVRGRAEPIRLLMSHLKMEWDEYVFNAATIPEQWEAFQKEQDNYEFHKVPLLQIDGHKICQTNAILRYLASKNGLHPTDPFQAWKVDSLSDHCTDILVEIRPIIKSDETGEKLIEFTDKKLLWTFGALEKRLTENSSQDFFVGESVTMADALWTNFYHSILAALESQDLKTVIEEKFPTLNAYFLKGPDRFPYLKTRPPSKL